MKLVPKHLILAGMLAYAGLSAQAQTPTDAPKGPPPAGHEHRGGPGGRFDPAKMQAFQAKRLADLKAKLKLTPAQEGAWTSFTGAMQPPAAGQRQRMDREAFKNMTTPQRIDAMEKRQAEHQAHMKERGEAVKAFYAQLTPAQQKTFDDRGARMYGPRGDKQGRGMHRPGHHHGFGPGMPGVPAAQ